MTRRTGPTPEVAELVRARNGGQCLRCGNRGEQIHHRTPRGMGGSREAWINEPPNLVFICAPCHLSIESNRTLAYRTGWLVRRGANPAEQYLLDVDNNMLMLLPDGTVTVTPAPVMSPDDPWAA